MNRLLMSALSITLLGAAACSDGETAAVEVTPGAAPTEVSDSRAATAATTTALALGMTRTELEDADLVSPGPEFTLLGDVESLVLDPAGQVTGLVIDLAGLDVDVVVPIGDVSSVRRENDVDVTTIMTRTQLQALPPFTADPD
ncbi:MAG: hypothetical protein KKA16_05335 [Alphaproteobacteria bacterium]|nr:hypothetical protein [Alphaproteobacteria bacterium]MBU2380286.1 hypothetical protein [Alphaproteobacteria bacterium]